MAPDNQQSNMPDLKEALASLGSIDYTSLPADQETFLKDTFRHAETVINSLPPASSSSPDPPQISTSANSARKAIDTAIATPYSSPIDAQYEELHKIWGKPYKMNSKDNPLGISVYKAAGYDKFGAWFGRRSVHKGIGYEKWKSAWQHEFLESLKVKGGPGAGAIRGITTDRRVEAHEVMGVGEVEGQYSFTTQDCRQILG